jgi:hypothetical protein
MEKTAFLRQLLVDYLELRHEAARVSPMLNYLVREPEARDTLYRKILIRMDYMDAFRLFSAQNDRIGLELMINSDTVPELVKRDCANQLNPGEKVKGHVFGHQQSGATYRPHKQLSGDTENSWDDVVRAIEGG